MKRSCFFYLRQPLFCSTCNYNLTFLKFKMNPLHKTIILFTFIVLSLPNYFINQKSKITNSILNDSIFYFKEKNKKIEFNIIKEKVYYLLPNESIYYKTNNGSEMLLRICNLSTQEKCYFYINGKGRSLLISLPPNMPDSTFYLINDWAGSQLMISNVTDSILNSTISVLLIGN